MKTLPNTWRSKGADYTVAQRKGDVVLIELRREGRTFYEVAIVQRHDGYTIAGKTMPPAEHVPSSCEWGQVAWSYPDLPSAMARFDSLQGQTARFDC